MKFIATTLLALFLMFTTSFASSQSFKDSAGTVWDIAGVIPETEGKFRDDMVVSTSQKFTERVFIKGKLDQKIVMVYVNMSPLNGKEYQYVMTSVINCTAKTSVHLSASSFHQGKAVAQSAFELTENKVQPNTIGGSIMKQVCSYKLHEITV